MSKYNFTQFIQKLLWGILVDTIQVLIIMIFYKLHRF